MDRRAFLQASSFAFTPLIARAQPTAKVRRIGMLTAGTVSTSEPSAFYAALRELGWVEGENLIIERRGAAGESEAVPPSPPSWCAPIVTKRGAWLGASVSVMPSVTIGENAVVAANAVVIRDVPDNTVVGGIPARVIKNF